MDKEKLITVGIGLAVGILAASAYFFATKYLPNIQRPENKVTFNPTPTQNQIRQPADKTENLNTLNISLDNYTSTTEAILTISGATTPGAKLVLFGPADEKIASADASGKFSVNLKLEDGENEISVTSFDNLGNTISIRRNITLEITQ